MAKPAVWAVIHTASTAAPARAAHHAPTLTDPHVDEPGDRGEVPGGRHRGGARGAGGVRGRALGAVQRAAERGRRRGGGERDEEHRDQDEAATADHAGADGTPLRVTATPAALALIAELRAEYGPVMFHQSGGCCDGSSPMCYPVGDFIISDGDVRLGDYTKLEDLRVIVVPELNAGTAARLGIRPGDRIDHPLFRTR